MRGQTWAQNVSGVHLRGGERIRAHRHAYSHVLDWSWSSALYSSRNVQGDLVGGMDAWDGTFGRLLGRKRRRHWMDRLADGLIVVM